MCRFPHRIAQQVGIMLEQPLLEILVGNRQVQRLIVAVVEHDRAKPGIKTLAVHLLADA